MSKHKIPYARLGLCTLAGATATVMILTACQSAHQFEAEAPSETVRLKRTDVVILEKQKDEVKHRELRAPVMERLEVSGARVANDAALGSSVAIMYGPPTPAPESRENYAEVKDNLVTAVAQEPVSTFALDVDTGAYSIVRRYLRDGELPPRDAVRVEELINYFQYSDIAAEKGHPFALQTELAPSPWNENNYLLRLRIKTVDMHAAELPPANLVFLVDVSGSMQDKDKLPLVQSSLLALVNELRAEDTISLVVYAGRTAVELEPTSGADKATIRAAISRLTAGGSTAGGAAIELAYAQAQKAFKKQGINRILLATDGDFNVGITDIKQLKSMVEKKRENGITVTTLGFGTGNYNDALMEQIADVGNGNYAYIDSADEARKVLITEMSSTFNVVAKDAKIQVEFNPSLIAEYRLIGYDNRLLNAEDFNNDKIDAGDVGAGKSVTALYELTPVGAKSLIDPLRYGEAQVERTHVKSESNEIAFLKLRYKPNAQAKSLLLQKPILLSHLKSSINQTSDDFKFSAAVAGFAQLLRGGLYTGQWDMQDAIRLARQGSAMDTYGYRAEFLRLAGVAEGLLPSASAENQNDRFARKE